MTPDVAPSAMAVTGARPVRAPVQLARLKRSFDLFFSLVLIVVLSPLLLALCLAVLIDGWPILYVHNRLGQGGRSFGCLKFRTMRVGADAALIALLRTDPAMREEWLSMRKIRHDPRVTRLGRFLRRTSLDELPQLFNIVRGEMSLVGPRPVVDDEFHDHYGAAAAELYLSVRPGLTGSWQVSGRSDTSFRERVVLDCDYVRHWTFKNDIRLLAMTVLVLLRRRGAY